VLLRAEALQLDNTRITSHFYETVAYSSACASVNNVYLFTVHNYTCTAYIYSTLF